MSGPFFSIPSSFSKRWLLGLALTAFAVTGCVSQAERDVPNWGGDYAEAPPISPPQVPQSGVSEPAVITQTTLPPLASPTQHCTGTYFVHSAKTQALLERGRAYNAGSHLVVLGKRGRGPRTIVATPAQNVTFLPDCGCNPSDQRASLPAPASCNN